jgi:hypothetical protein
MCLQELEGRRECDGTGVRHNRHSTQVCVDREKCGDEPIRSVVKVERLNALLLSEVCRKVEPSPHRHDGIVGRVCYPSEIMHGGIRIQNHPFKGKLCPIPRPTGGFVDKDPVPFADSPRSNKGGHPLVRSVFHPTVQKEGRIPTGGS